MKLTETEQQKIKEIYKEANLRPVKASRASLKRARAIKFY